jgi:hypothetical protein
VRIPFLIGAVVLRTSVSIGLVILNEQLDILWEIANRAGTTMDQKITGDLAVAVMENYLQRRF